MTGSDMPGKFTLRAVRDFESSQMNRIEKRKLSFISKRIIGDSEKIYCEQHLRQGKNAMHQQQSDESGIINKCHKEYDKDMHVPDYNENAEIKESGLPTQDNQTAPKDDFSISDKVCSIRDEKSVIQNQEVTKLEAVMMPEEKSVIQNQEVTKLEAVMVPEELSADIVYLRSASCLDVRTQCEIALTLKTGDKMETIHPANIGDIDGWWLVKHLDNGNIGFIPRNCVVIEKDRQPYDTTLNNLPLELLDFMLGKSYLHWVLNLSPDQRDRDDIAIKALASVDVCWFQRMKRRRFKKRIWKQLKAFYDETKRRTSIIRNNRNYFLENNQPNDEMVLPFNCITEEESHFIQRQRSNRDKNAKLLYFMESFDEAKFSNFVKCLRQSNQKTMARIIENGGAVLKVQVQSRVAQCLDIQQIHQKIESFRNRSADWSHQTDRPITHLREGDIEILNSKPDNKMVVVWMWCHSQWAVENLQWLYESNQLRHILFDFANARSSSRETIQSIAINIDRHRFKKTVAVSGISMNIIERIDDEDVCGITKLRNEIYVAYCSGDHKCVFHVFEDRNPFGFKKKIDIKDIRIAADIGSSEKNNCLYVSDVLEKCIWKITKETDDEYKIIKWLITNRESWTLSVSRHGHLLLIDYPNLKIYGSDAKLIRFILLPSDFGVPRHAVETSTGNVIIIHSIKKEKRDWPNGHLSTGDFISELTSDGQVVRRFLSRHDELYDPKYISLDSDEHVFLVDTSLDGMVILFDSDLKWNQILCRLKAKEERTSDYRQRLYYDEENKQLFVGGDMDGGINVYSFSRK